MRCKNNINKLIGKGKRDLVLNLRIVLDQYNLTEDLQKFKLLINIFNEDSELILWNLVHLYTKNRLN